VQHASSSIALRWAMRHSDHTVMVSRATQRQFAADLGLNESRIKVVPNGVPVRNGNAERGARGIQG